MFRHVPLLTTLLFVTVPSAPVQADTCIEFYGAEKIAEIENETVSESSGLALSRQHADLLWTHNDSGDAARFYALSQSGQDRGTINLSSASAEDWEAMAIGPCGDNTCLVLADVGDNNRERENISLWRLPEPTPTGAGTSQILTAEEIRAVYPAGAQDCEGIALDPLTGDVLMVEKSMTSKARTHLIPSSAWDTSGDVPLTLEELPKIDFETDSLTGGLVTGVDISPSGVELFVRTYIAGFHVPLTRDESGRINGFGLPRQVTVYDDGQCEAVAYDSTGLELWFTCEDENGPIARATCKTIQDDETGGTTVIEQEGCSCYAAEPLWLLLLLTALGVRRLRHYGSAN